MKKYIVVNNPKNWHISIEGVEVVSVRNYLTDTYFASLKNIRVFNLSREYRYQSKGYYVSLLAEARGHKVIPSVKNIQDMKAPAIVRILSDELDILIQKSLKKLSSESFDLSVYFGKNISPQYDKLCQELYLLFQAPLFRVKFGFNGKKWIIQGIKTIPFNEVSESHMEYLNHFALEYFSRKRYYPAKEDPYIYDLAILINPEEKSPPSDKGALNKFVLAAEKLGFSVEFITKNDYSRVSEFDALFIRETTSVNHHTYRIARRAQSEGLPVIDDPDSILKCTNKVYLAELLFNADVPAPKTIIVHNENVDSLVNEMGYPIVLKLPDSSFSQGVIKVTNKDELDVETEKMFAISDLIIAQEYIPTEYDWRIGVLDNKILYACKYFMARGHWQIYNWKNPKKDELYGEYETIPVEEVPQKVLDIALKAVKLIGNGLYGVDIKEYQGKVFIIEINDNPNIDLGVEDKIIKDNLYLSIIKSLKNRIEKRAGINLNG